MKKRLLLLMLAIFLVSGVVYALPEVPFAPWGTVTINNASVSDGTSVIAMINGTVYATMIGGTLNSYYALIIPADNTETPGKDGGVDGDTVIVVVGGNAMLPNLTWEQGSRNFNLTFTSVPDITPPASITGLTSPPKSTDWVYWTWTNPSDLDFDTAIVYLNGVNVVNTSNNFYNASGLNNNVTYTITIHTQDTSGNVNIADVSDIQTPLAGPDITPPGSISSLLLLSKSPFNLFWIWTNPIDLDFAQNIIFIDGLNVFNTSSNFYNASSLTPSTSYTINVHTKDTTGNVNTVDVTDTQTTDPSADITPPGSVTSLISPSKSIDWVYWTWTNPADADFDQAIVFIDGVNVVNTSNNFFNATGLIPNTGYTITVHTKDTTGNVNTVNVIDVQTTDPGPDITPP